MIVNLKVPDPVWESYAAFCARGKSGNPIKPEALMISQLERFRGVSPSDRVIVVGSRERAALEKILSSGHLQDGVDLKRKVEQLATLEIGGVKVDFSPAEWGQLKRYADKNGKSLQQVVETTVRQMRDQFFDYTPAGVI